MYPWLPLVTALLVASSGGVTGFNVNVDRAVTYMAGAERGQARPREGALFGFAITQHLNVKGKARILVGAPRANTSQPQIVEGGAVYDCDILGTSDLSCREMVFDHEGNWKKNMANIGRPDELYEQKSGQWFGATVVSARNHNSGSAMACAPRYQYFSLNTDKRLPIGICYFYNGITNKITKLNPLKEIADFYTNKDSSKFEQFAQEGKAQYGLSAALSPDGATMLVGVPGSFSWSGRFLVHTINDPIHPKRSRGAAYFVKRNNYFGYAVAFGNFTPSKELDYVVSAPRGGTELSIGPGTLSGTIRVLQLETKKQNPQIEMPQDLFAGDQMGQYLGYSLAVGDFNADGLDDIAAGAPFYSAKGSYDTGRVLILTQTKLGIINRGKRRYLEGNRRPGEMFGISLAVIGDINQDGFTDLAVGAPYGGRQGHGAVYVFHGSPQGLKYKISQMIDAMSISNKLLTFGFSLSAGLDMDRNGYPDITVGGHESGSVVQLWSHPVIRLYLNLIVPPTVRLVGTSRPGEEDKQTEFFVHISHSHKGNEPLSTTKLDITVRLDADRNTAPRAYFLIGTKKTATYRTQISIYNIEAQSALLPLPAYIKRGMRDKLSPIIVEVEYHVTSQYPGGLAPVFDVDIPTTIRAEITIDKNCGPDRTCIADLSLSADALTKTFVLGTSAIDLNVTVENLEPDGGYEALVTIQLPPGTLYAKVYNIKGPVTVRCSPVNTAGQVKMGTDSTDVQDRAEMVICEIGNPLPGYGKVEFTLQFDAKNFDGSINHLNFDFNASSSNPENATTLDNNHMEVTIPVRAVTPLWISGTSNPEQIIFVPDDDADKRQGKPTISNIITHLYEVQNLGPSSVQTANVTVYWPSRFPDEDDMGDLFTLMSAKVEQGRRTTNCSILYEAPSPARNTTDTDSPKSRKKRNTQTFTEKLFQAEKYNKKVVCLPGGGEPWCAIIRCRVGQLGPDERALVRVEAHLSPASLNQLPHMTILVTSQGVAQVDSLPYEGIVQTNTRTSPVAVDTVLATKGPGQTFQWWIVAVAVASGLLLLVALVVVLYKCGFFKRNQYGNEDAILNSVDGDEDEDDDDDEEDMLVRFAGGEAGNRNSRIDTVNRKLILQNGISLSIEEKR